MTDWQPIETAPKDGRHVLLLDLQGAIVARWEPDSQRWVAVFGNNEVYIYGNYEAYSIELSPLHWMPLPEPPDA